MKVPHPSDYIYISGNIPKRAGDSDLTSSADIIGNKVISTALPLPRGEQGRREIQLSVIKLSYSSVKPVKSIWTPYVFILGNRSLGGSLESERQTEGNYEYLQWRWKRLKMLFSQISPTQSLPIR
jgi:hypothetical protein